MQIDDIIRVSEQYMILENKTYVISILNSLKNMDFNTLVKFLRDKAQSLFDQLESNGINRKTVIDIVNKNLGVRVSPKSILSHRIKESKRLDEGWWQEASKNVYGSLSFYPILTTFIELDKVIKGSGDADVRAMGVYFILWVAIISGKVVIDKAKDKKMSKKLVKQEV